MKTKLLLKVKKSVMTKAKMYSRKSGKSISALVEEIFEDLADPKINPKCSISSSATAEANQFIGCS